MSQKPITYLVTGGTGFIGSHIVWELLSTGHNVIVIDNLSRSSDTSLKRTAKTLLGSSDLEDPAVTPRLRLYKVDLTDPEAVNRVFESHPEIWGVVHIAAFKSVPESHAFPEKYKGNNVFGSEVLVKCMERHGIYNLVFSSSACVYGEPKQIPIPETSPLFATNPYGQSKIDTENLLHGLVQTSPKWKIIILRYFNPVGAHPSGIIGEDPKGLVSNLLPIVAQVASKKRVHVQVFGTDFNTEDGSALRDYIHIMDLVKGHIAAFVKFSEPGLWVYNLGTGKGYSVLQVISAFERVSGQKIPYEITGRRSGDVPVLIADPLKANKELNWAAEKSLDEMCQDLWNFICKNPDGYE